MEAKIHTKYGHFFESNRKAWDIKTPIHVESDFYDLKTFEQTGSSLYSIEKNELTDVSNKKILHLQCHFGLDTLSLAKLGAECVGVDFSEISINKAKELGEKFSSNTTFINANVYDIESYLSYNYFDIIYCSYGAITWLPDLREWARILSSFLKPNGIFYIVDFHPLLIALNYLDNSEIQLSYYNNEKPIEKVRKGTYTNTNANIEVTEYTWNHSISEIVNSLIQNHFEIEYLNEFDFVPFNCFSNLIKNNDGNWQVKNHKGLYPLCFSIKARRK